MQDHPPQDSLQVPPTAAPQERRRRRVSPLFWLIGLSSVLFLVFVLFGSRLILKSTLPQLDRGLGSSKKLVGVIELNGIILESKKILKQLRAFEDESAVKAVVLRLNSPGGAVAPSQEIHQAVKAFPKPLVVSMSSVAASGAYYIAAGSKKVFANPGTITGSIGVIMQFTNLEKLYEWAKIARYSIKTGQFKDAGADYRAMTPEERALLQGMVDDTLAQFKSAVREGRKLTGAEVDAVADGRIFSGAQAKKAKLVDELGSLQDAIDEAGRQARIEGRPKVIYPEKQRQKFIEWLLSGDGEDSESEAQGAIVSGIQEAMRRALGLPRQGVALEPGVYWLLPWGH